MRSILPDALSLAGRQRPGSTYLAGAPLLIAHRGGAALAPENTMLAFRRAAEWWRADVLEVDVHATQDGEAVVIHDPTVDRTTDGAGAVAALTLSELCALDAGYHFSGDGGATHSFRGMGASIPTLVEVLRELPGLRINVEVKDSRAQPAVWDAVHGANAAHRVLIAAGTRGNRSRFDRGYAGATSAAESEIFSFWLHLQLRAGRLARPTVDAFQVPERHRRLQVVSPRFIRAAHARNIAVHVWTVNEETAMRRLLEWGVDGLVTDRPDILARVLHETHGRPLPPGEPE
ncbi:MAG: glycerophosphodiester phosphodiesterase [Gemmatimonadota bacterium]|nr:glycerophosphodiester phosphodiesterase [Gemmatimonadota bacterium]